MTIAKIAGLPEHKMRVELPKDVSQSEFIYQLGYAEGFVRAMTIAFKESPKDSALSLYSEQCK